MLSLARRLVCNQGRITLTAPQRYDLAGERAFAGVFPGSFLRGPIGFLPASIAHDNLASELMSRITARWSFSGRFVTWRNFFHNRLS